MANIRPLLVIIVLLFVTNSVFGQKRYQQMYFNGKPIKSTKYIKTPRIIVDGIDVTIPVADSKIKPKRGRLNGTEVVPKRTELLYPDRKIEVLVYPKDHENKVNSVFASKEKGVWDLKMWHLNLIPRAENWEGMWDDPTTPRPRPQDWEFIVTHIYWKKANVSDMDWVHIGDVTVIWGIKKSILLNGLSMEWNKFRIEYQNAYDQPLVVKHYIETLEEGKDYIVEYDSLKMIDKGRNLTSKKSKEPVPFYARSPHNMSEQYKNHLIQYFNSRPKDYYKPESIKKRVEYRLMVERKIRESLLKNMKDKKRLNSIQTKAANTEKQRRAKYIRRSLEEQTHYQQMMIQQNLMRAQQAYQQKMIQQQQQMILQQQRQQHQRYIQDLNNRIHMQNLYRSGKLWGYKNR